MRRRVFAVVVVTAVALLLGGLAVGQSPNGSAGQMPAFYDHDPITINFYKLPDAAAKAVLANNKSINKIYMSDQCSTPDHMYTAVIDALQGPGQGPGFNPLWQEFQIVFPSVADCVQFTSDADILNAAAPPAPTIILVPTTEVYRCSVVGRKH